MGDGVLRSCVNGHPMREEAKFCEECGQPAPEVTTGSCPKCGSPVQGLFCPVCIASTHGSTSPSTHRPGYHRPKSDAVKALRDLFSGVMESVDAYQRNDRANEAAKSRSAMARSESRNSKRNSEKVWKVLAAQAAALAVLEANQRRDRDNHPGGPPIQSVPRYDIGVANDQWNGLDYGDR
jgi:hypothetical protein